MIRQILYALIATAGFAFMFNIRTLKDILFASLGGALSWGMYIGMYALTDSKIFGFFIASVAVGIYAEILAIILKRPATVFIVSAVIPLVPGGGIYYTMTESIRGNIDGTLSFGFETISIAGAIAAGIAIASSLVRLLSRNR
jgi:uncharacterized membrane protein YjjB (DUF3815 family)